MAWGCKPANYPDGCGWAARVTHGKVTEWWCDVCERAGATARCAMSNEQPWRVATTRARMADQP